MPADWGDITERIFPQINIWRYQMASPTGDKSEAAKNFVTETLPYLARVIVQDGIYWIRDYPNHPVSILIRNVMPPAYEQWAQARRALVEQQIQNRQQSRVQELNGAAQASYNHLDGRVGRVENNMDTMRADQQSMRADQ